MSTSRDERFKVFAFKIAELFKILCELFRVKLLDFLFFNFKINHSKYVEINVELSKKLVVFL